MAAAKPGNYGVLELGGGDSANARVLRVIAVSTTMKYQHQDIDEVAAVASKRIQ
jgi:hypothetical protein